MNNQNKTQNNTNPKNLYKLLHIVEIVSIVAIVVALAFFYTIFSTEAQSSLDSSNLQQKQITKLRECMQTGDHECKGV